MSSFLFEPLSLEHIPLLHKWMREPHVWQWWGEGKKWTFDELLEKYRSYTLGFKIEQGERRPISAFIIHCQERPIGFIQMYDAFDFPTDGFKVEELWLDRSKSLAAIDFYIGEPDCIGVGIGPEALREFLAKHVFQNFDACLADPDNSNTTAVKAYVKAGFSAALEMSSSIAMLARKEIKKQNAFLAAPDFQPDCLAYLLIKGP